MCALCVSREAEELLEDHDDVCEQVECEPLGTPPREVGEEVLDELVPPTSKCIEK